MVIIIFVTNKAFFSTLMHIFCFVIACLYAYALFGFILHFIGILLARI